LYSSDDIAFFSSLLPPTSPLFPYTTLFRSLHGGEPGQHAQAGGAAEVGADHQPAAGMPVHTGPQPQRQQQTRCVDAGRDQPGGRSEEHTSELQSRENLVCRLLLEKKKKNNI